MMATIAVIAAITEKKNSSAIAAIIAIIMETTFSMRSLRLLETGFLMIAVIAEPLFDFFSAITAIVAIIWKPGLSYASLLNKIRFNNYNT